MNSEIIKNNKELLKILEDYSLKSQSSLDEGKDLDLLISPEEKVKVASLLKNYGGKCFLENKSEIKFILPLKNKPYFRIVHLNMGEYKKRRRIFRMLFSFFNYWRASSTIVFLGADGSGKSTLAKKTADILSSFFNVNLQYFGWNKFFIPIFWITRKRSAKVKTNNRKEKLSWFYLSVYYLELLLRYFFNILPKKILGRTIIIDRYFYDKLVHLKSNSFKFRFFNMITPKPDFIILLVDDPRRIYNRKKEISISEIERIQDLYLRKKDLLNFIVVKNEKGIDNTLGKIITIIRSELIKRKRVLE